MSETWPSATSTPTLARPNFNQKKNACGTAQRLDLLHHLALAQLGAVGLFEEPETKERKGLERERGSGERNRGNASEVDCAHGRRIGVLPRGKLNQPLGVNGNALVHVPSRRLHATAREKEGNV